MIAPDPFAPGPFASGLAKAARVFAERCAQPDPEPAAAFLQRHASLREWLEPMLAEAGDEAAPTTEAGHVGPYRLLREIGHGGMGVVHEARRGDDPTPIALKLLPAFLATRDSNVARFQREGELGGRLDHPGIVRVLDADTAGDTHYLAMRFVIGAPLDQVLQSLRDQEPQSLTAQDLATAVHRCLHVPMGQRTPTPSSDAFAGSYVAAVVRLMIQLAEALAHAHAAGVIHRDIKPSNLLVGADACLVLTDLGLARDVRVPTLTMTGDFAGTPHYVSPEQAMAKRVHVDHRTDLFSLGSTLYELLTLQRAFAGETTQEVLGRILTKEPPTPTRWHPGLPEDLVTVVGKLLEKDPDRRYQSADMLATDLRAFLEYRRVAARRASLMTRVLRWPRREPLRATMVLLLVVVVASLTCGAGYLWARRDEIRAGREQLWLQTVAGQVDAGFLASMFEDEGGSLRQFESALALDPHNTAAQIGLLLALLHHDGPEVAWQRLEHDLAARMSPVLCDLLRFHLLTRLQRDQEARTVLARIGPPSTEFELWMQGMIHRDRGEHTGAEVLQYVERAVIAGERPRLWMNVQWAEIADAANDAGSCRRCAANLQLNWPDSPIAWYAACLALSHADPEQARRLVQSALAAHPDQAVLHLADGVVQSARGDHRGAIPAFARAVALAPAIATFHYALGKAHYEADDAAAAIVELQAACDLSPRFVDAWIGLGMAQRQSGLLDAALASLHRAVALHPNNAPARFQLGQTLVKLRQLPAAIVELQAAIRLNPGDPNKWHHLASARFASGDRVGGLDALRRAVAADPTYERGHTMLVMYLQGNGTEAETRAALEAWVAAVPGSVDAWMRYGLHCVSRDMPAELRDGVTGAWAAQRVLALTENRSATAWFMLGEARTMLGQVAAARTAMQTSLAETRMPLSTSERVLCERRLRELPAAAVAEDSSAAKR